jgi:hypothetical protein
MHNGCIIVAIYWFQPDTSPIPMPPEYTPPYLRRSPKGRWYAQQLSQDYPYRPKRVLRRLFCCRPRCIV